VIYSLLDDASNLGRRFVGFVGGLFGARPGTDDGDGEDGGEPPAPGSSRGSHAVIATLIGVAVGVGAVVYASNVWAQAATATPILVEEPGGLTPERVEQIARERSAALDALEAQEAAAAFAVRLAQLAYAPRVELSANHVRLSEVDSGGFGSKFVGVQDVASGELPDDAKLFAFEFSFPQLTSSTALRASMLVPLTDYLTQVRHQTRQAGAALERSRFELEAARARIGYGARMAYWQWVAARTQKRIAEESLQLADAFARSARIRVAAEAAPPVDVIQADARIAAARLDLARAETSIVLATDTLRVLTGDDQLTPTLGRVPATTTEPAPDVATLLDSAATSRAELSSLQAAERVQAAAADQTRAGLFPRLDAIGDLQYANPNQRYQPQQDEFNASWSLGLQVTWSPNAALAADPQRQRALAQLSAIRAQRSSTADDIRSAVVAAQARWTESVETLRQLQTILAAQEEAYRLRHVAYEVGRATSLEVLDAQTQLVNARINAALAQIRYEVAREEVRFVSGHGDEP
jgi:outer membrane protein TolC